MGYIDLGKWVTAVEAGSRFGCDLVLMVLLFNFSAIICQYLAACIGMVTGKNLAQICRQEYNQPTCIFLGVQAGLSLLTSELTMISGVVLGFNLLFEYDDLIKGICFATVAVNPLPYTISCLDKKVAGTLNAVIAGFALLCYILGLLVSQPQIPLTMNVMYPKLSGESAYSLMALLGANIITHNFYVHSSVVQDQKRSPILAFGALFHDHLFSILFIFTGIFLVNYVLMNSAAVESSNTLILTFQDVVELMNQIFINPVAPLVFLVVLLFASHIISLTSMIGSQAIAQHLFGIKLPLSGNHLLLKIFAVVPTIYCAKVAGAEGIYQLLITCQIIQAMFLPSSVIPLFRIASSRLIMGNSRISLYLEILAFLSFLLMLSSNIIFAVEILFGGSSWMHNLKGNTGSPVVLPYTVLVVISCASIIFTLFLAVTPLKSSHTEAEAQERSMHSQQKPSDIPQDREETSLEYDVYEVDQRFAADAVPKDSFESHNKSSLKYIDSSGTAVESDHDSQRSNSYMTTIPETCSSPSYIPEESESNVVVDWTEALEKVSTANIVEDGASENIESKSTAEKDAEVEADVCVDNDGEDSRNMKFERSLGGGASSFTSDGPPSLTLSREKGTDAGDGSGNGNISRLSSLGRAARRQLAAILDEFWGHLFDYHGRLTQEARTKRFDVLLGLDLRTVGSAVQMDNPSTEAPKSLLMGHGMRGSDIVTNSRDSISPDKEISKLDLTYVLQMGTIGSLTLSQGMQLPNADMQSSSNSRLEQSSKLYSNFNSASSSDNQFYQPATIHGYHLASYMKGLNANRIPYSSMPVDPQQPPRSSASAIPNYVDSIMHGHNQNLLGSLGATSFQSPTVSHISAMMMERSNYDPSPIDGSESVGSTAYSKKYHSSPDVSALIAASRNALWNEAKLGVAIGTQSYLSRLPLERSQYLDSITRSRTPLTFDELSQPNLQRDVFCMQSSMSPSAKSLRAKQTFEQLFGVSSTELNKYGKNAGRRSIDISKDDFSYVEFEAKLLQSLRFCIVKLLKLEGSGWLFRQNGGCDEYLIDQLAAAERLSQEETTENQLSCGDLQHLPSDQFQSLRRNDEGDAHYMRMLPKCGDDCVWRASLVVSFGVWCIHRVLDLTLVESRPELWGKYTYVLNRLQGILEPAFSNPRNPLIVCACLEKGIRALCRPLNNGPVGPVAKPIKGTFTTAAAVLEMMKEVELAVSGRKGRSGTAAGDVAFPKGKENLASVLKRYKRRLASKPSAGQ